MKKKEKPFKLLLLLLLPTIVVVALAVILMHWRRPTRIRFTGSVARVVFTVSGQEPHDVLTSVQFRSIAVERFDRLEMNPDSVAVTDSANFAQEKERPENWKTAAFLNPIVVRASETTLMPSVAIEPEKSDAKMAGTLDRLWARPATNVVFEKTNTGRPSIALRLNDQPSAAVLSFASPFHLFTDYCRVEGVESPYRSAESQALRLHLPPSNPNVEVTARNGHLTLQLTFPEQSHQGFFPSGGIPVSAIDFTHQASDGEVESALVRPGEVEYLDEPRMAKIPVDAHSFVKIENLKKFRIDRISMNPETHKLELTASGIAGTLKMGPAGFGQDRRITYFDTLWQNPRLALLYSIIIWIFPTTVGAFRLYKELRK